MSVRAAGQKPSPTFRRSGERALRAGEPVLRQRPSGFVHISEAARITFVSLLILLGTVCANGRQCVTADILKSHGPDMSDEERKRKGRDTLLMSVPSTVKCDKHRVHKPVLLLPKYAVTSRPASSQLLYRCHRWKQESRKGCLSNKMQQRCTSNHSKILV